MLSRTPIQILSPDTVGKIAAGEVIERPASIVKELMENSIDAFATSIEVSVTGAGLENLRVKDDGIGISPKDLPLSIVKNATSKITSDQDLLTLQTNGFRGEALSSIACVSRFTITTKAQGFDLGYQLQCEGSQEPTIKPSASLDGTIIEVQDLFFNTPARKKFLKGKTTENTHIDKAFKKIALAHPHIQFTLIRDGKTVFQLSPTQSFLERIQQFYGTDACKSLQEFSHVQGPLRAYGFASNTHHNTNNPNEIWIFVNQRWIQDRALFKAVQQGYRGTLMENQYPFTFLYLDIPGHLLDVNVHPTKSEVRFQDQQTLFRLVQQAISASLSSTHAHHEIRFTPKPNHFTPTQTELQKVTKWIGDSPLNLTNSISLTKERGFFGQLTYLATLDGTYLICKNDHELILIDQHAAHERVRYEKLKKEFEEKKHLTQKKLIPLHISLEPQQLKALEKIKDFLFDMGLEWEYFGDQDILIHSIPNLLQEKDATKWLTHIIDQTTDNPTNAWFEEKINHTLSSLACHSAVRAHDRLSHEEIIHLLDEMDEVSFSSYCPHGRPTFLKMNLENLEKLFRRTV